MNQAAEADRRRTRALRGTVLAVALLNGAYLVVEIILALGIGSVALVADSVDFFEDFAVNLLIFVALGWTAARQAVIGKVMAGIIVLPAVAALVMAATKIGDPEPPAAGVLLGAGGAPHDQELRMPFCTPPVGPALLDAEVIVVMKTLPFCTR